MIVIDGSFGEGGGQIVRSSLALSMVTGKPVTIEEIRARRSRAGLQRQHLTAVLAAQKLSAAGVEGAELQSHRLVFRPHRVWPGDYTFDIGSAGSTSLVMQTILPALMLADGPSHVRLIGGTHNIWAPPFDFLAKVYAPLVERIGPRLKLELKRYGFYPAGGGEVSLHVQPAEQLDSFELTQRGARVEMRVVALLSKLPQHIGERECRTIQSLTGWDDTHFEVRPVDADGPGNAVIIELQYENVTELFAGFGQKGVAAEEVARRACEELDQYLATDAPVGQHLADQLLLPLGLAAQQGRAGRFRTGELTEHSRTHIEVLQRFLDVRIKVETEEKGTNLVSVEPRQ
jgi:RNA 3'-terminal phosphate cyclase (ATP)